MEVSPLDEEELRAIHDALEENIKDIRHLYQKLCTHYGSKGDHDEDIIQEALDAQFEKIRPLRKTVTGLPLRKG